MSRAGVWNSILAEISRLEKANDPDAVELGNLYYTLFAVEKETFDPAKLTALYKKWRRLFDEARSSGLRKAS